VGRPRAPGVAAAISEYEQRAAHYWPFEAIEVREEPAKSGSPDLIRDREGERLLKAVPAGAHVVACEPGGRGWDSLSFAKWLQQERERASDVAFVIGGALGLSANVVKAARTQLSLAPWTLPHEMARLVLSEQIYRAGTIGRGEPYNK
jgi:23S rRNA (pseudouridine1915-N3)-methyltransferase